MEILPLLVLPLEAVVVEYHEGEAEAFLRIVPQHLLRLRTLLRKAGMLANGRTIIVPRMKQRTTETITHVQVIGIVETDLLPPLPPPVMVSPSQYIK